MTNNTQEQYNKFLKNIAEELDIPPSKYQQAVQRYSSVGNWLKEGEYEGCTETPYIYPQGSFRLGTVVRPIKEGEESDYDIDLVCQFPISKVTTNPSKIKTLVGDRLREYAVYAKMLDKEGRRCWTLNYKEEDGIGFHLDILPSVPEDQIPINEVLFSEFDKYAIAITDKKNNEYNWLSSNPNGYAEWFDQKKKESFNLIKLNEKTKIYGSNRNIYKNVDEVPDQLVKTPLQRAIQILKRHRDMRFAGHEWEGDKPISMIITTLCAHLYQSESDTFSTLKNIVERLNAYAQLIDPKYPKDERIYQYKLIKKEDDGTWYIQNPVNPEENFADKWHENSNRKARLFFKWISWVKDDLIEILNGADITKMSGSLEKHFGENITRKAASKILGTAPALLLGNNNRTPHIEIKNPSKPWGTDYDWNIE